MLGMDGMTHAKATHSSEEEDPAEEEAQRAALLEELEHQCADPRPQPDDDIPDVETIPDLETSQIPHCGSPPFPGTMIKFQYPDGEWQDAKVISHGPAFQSGNGTFQVEFSTDLGGVTTQDLHYPKPNQDIPTRWKILPGQSWTILPVNPNRRTTDVATGGGGGSLIEEPTPSQEAAWHHAAAVASQPAQPAQRAQPAQLAQPAQPTQPTASEEAAWGAAAAVASQHTQHIEDTFDSRQFSTEEKQLVMATLEKHRQQKEVSSLRELGEKRQRLNDEIQEEEKKAKQVTP